MLRQCVRICVLYNNNETFLSAEPAKPGGMVKQESTHIHTLLGYNTCGILVRVLQTPNIAVYSHNNRILC